LASLLGLSNTFKNHKWEYSWDANEPTLTKDYPLAAHFNYYGSLDSAARKENEHIYAYVNAVYAARKDGKNV
jgi:hypothetical protein